MRILLTNDDGLKTEGLKALHNELERVFGQGTITVVSPLHQQSAVSHSITIFSPLFIEKVNGYLNNKSSLYAVQGTPTDCVKLALRYLMNSKPAVVVSGINEGANVGVDVFYSGTVAGAIEGALWGIPSFAVSTETPNPAPLGVQGKVAVNPMWFTGGKRPDFKLSARLAVNIIKTLLDAKLPAGRAFNINVPNSGRRAIKGIKYTRQDIRLSPEEFERGIDPRGRHYYWMKPGPKRFDLRLSGYHSSKYLKRIKTEECILPSDLETLRAGYISVTPLRTNLTDYQLLAYLPKHIAKK